MHLTGDIHAVSAATNLLAAAIDARMFHERNLTDTTLYQRLVSSKAPSSSAQFTPAMRRRLAKLVASELMAILALANDLPDLKYRIGRMVVGFSHADDPVTVDDIGVTGTYAPYSAFVADIWALGVTLYALLFGKLPYFAPDVTDLFDMIQSPQPVDVPESASVDLRELLRGLLEKDPTKRMTFADIRHHPWVVMGLAIDAVAAFQTRCHDAVEITEHDVEHALTKISSVSTITTMKVRGKKWAMKARQKTLDRNASSVSAKSEDDDVSPHDNIQAA
ncbi:hypothetical protein DYB25_001833 [Aphanomyces astaci]|uniref:Protein kinase domain-containing protein n=1 Tax=Aphanomyces astaci TaxID=112090 RepID=A0A397AB02_APHAT|nr:hypothetical protein DYB25_001833 [Aphanomyces astaci]